ncbi:MAG: amidohydrolase family protein [Opitutaceae bacterium]|nr:amidohydrolase family protein [Opitutaceae bacterium]
MAFFSDAMGRITRFSREPADLAQARRLPGQAALPGLVNTHSHSFHRVLRGRGEHRARGDRPATDPWRQAHDRAAERMTAEGIFDTARMAFMEMLLAGITCVGEFHYLHGNADGAGAGGSAMAREVVRAAHDVGIRIALLNAAWIRGDFGAPAGSAPPAFRSATVADFVRSTETLRTFVAGNYPADEAWVGVGIHHVGGVTVEDIRAIANYGHAQRLRLHAHVGTSAEENARCIAEHGRGPVALLAENGVLDKRFTAVDAIHATDDEAKLLGAARACVCACPTAAQNHGLGAAPVEKFIAAGAAVALGSDTGVQIDLLRDARTIEYGLRTNRPERGALSPDPAVALLHAATVAGARSLGATGGGLEVGRPADFFTINLFEPSIAGADADTLLANIVFALERRAIRDVWIGARQRIANGRHVAHGTIVGRFVELQQRLWSQP